jgi:hypothetical protein
VNKHLLTPLRSEIFACECMWVTWCAMSEWYTQEYVMGVSLCVYESVLGVVRESVRSVDMCVHVCSGYAFMYVCAVASTRPSLWVRRSPGCPRSSTGPGSTGSTG